jgi:hypothetical protein
VIRPLPQTADGKVSGTSPCSHPATRSRGSSA